MCPKNFHAVQNYLCFFRLKLIVFLYTGLTSFVARQELIARVGKLLHCNGSAVSKSSLFCACLIYALAEGPMSPKSWFLRSELGKMAKVDPNWLLQSFSEDHIISFLLEGKNNYYSKELHIFCC